MKILVKIFQVILAVIIPFVLLMASIRLLLTPLTIDIEYKLPNVPADTYGFTQAERTQYAKSAIRFLTNRADIPFLSDQTNLDGSPLYNERELSHMQDVKTLVTSVTQIWLWALVYLLLVGLGSELFKRSSGFWRALRDGGWATLGLIFVILVGVSINFDETFTIFHQIFFTGDTWLFFYSDTLIRLFPMEFWLNLFIAMGGLTILFAVLLIIFGNRWAKKTG